MSEMTAEQQRFQDCLRAEGYSMVNFASVNLANLFPNQSGEEPQFFKHNLVSPHRILKVFENDVHSNIRIFYYQLLCVTFEIQTESGFNTSFMYNLIHIVFNQDFEILFTPETESQRDLYCDFQFKKLFAEFVTMIQNQESPNIEQILNSYPVMDVVFIHIFRSIMASQGIDYPFQSAIPTNVVFTELCGLVGLVVASFNSNCWKFEDSDMFCYEHNEMQLYLAYTKAEGYSADAAGDAYQADGSYQYQNSYESNYQSNYSGIPQQNDYSNSYEAPNSYELNSYAPSRSNYQTLSDMANRHIAVEPTYDYVETSLRATVPGNEVKESMISVTYDFVDFTGESTAYKDHVPRRLANASGFTQSKPADAGALKSSGFDQYINTKPTDSLANYHVTSSIAPEPLRDYDSYKPSSNFESYLNPLPITPVTAPMSYQDDFSSLYKSAAPISNNYTTYDSFKTSEMYNSQTIPISKPLYGLDSYTPAYTGLASVDTYKPSTALDSFGLSSYQTSYEAAKPASANYDLKPIIPSYDPVALYSPPQRLVEPIPVRRQEQKFTGVLNLEPTTSSTIFESNYSVDVKYSAPMSLLAERLGTGDLGDYYNDFTSDNLLTAVTEPYRSNVLQIKSRVRGWKKSGIFSRSDIKPFTGGYNQIGYA